MRRNSLAGWTLLVLAVGLVLPASVTATGPFRYRVMADYCHGDYSWSNYLKVKETARGWSAANRLSIDSKAQARDPGHPRWYTAHEWPRVTSSFAITGYDHTLTLARSIRAGGVDTGARIVFTLRAWHNSNLLWSATVKSMVC